MKLEYKKLVSMFLLILLTATALTSLDIMAPVSADPKPMTQFTCRIFDQGLDTDGNGLYDFLEVKVELNVTEHDTYYVDINDLIDSEGDYLSFYNKTEVDLNVGVQNVTILIYGPRIAYERFNPVNISWIRLWSEHQEHSKGPVELSREYNYTEFDAPFNDYDVKLIVYPDGQVEVEGTVNATHMLYPPPLTEYGDGVILEFEDGFWWCNGSTVIYVPSIDQGVDPEEFPFNSTYFSYYEYLLDGINYGNMNFTMLLPPEFMELLPPEFKDVLPLNAIDFEMIGTFDGDDLGGSIQMTLTTNLTTLLTTLLEFPFGFNETVEIPLHLSLDYDKGEYNGTLSFYLIEGLPVKFLDIDIDGTLSSICLNGSVDVIYGDYGPPIDMKIDKTMIDGFEAMGLGLVGDETTMGTLLNMTGGMLNCTSVTIDRVNITGGETVSFKICISEAEDQTGAVLWRLLDPLLGEFNINESMWVYSALNDTLNKIQNGKLELTYTPSTTTTDLWLNGTIHMRDIFEQLLEPIEVPPEWQEWGLPPEINETVLPCVWVFVEMMNASICSIEDTSMHLSYSGEEGRIDFNSTYTMNIESMMQDMVEYMPDVRECYQPLLDPEMQYYESMFYEYIMDLLKGTYFNVTWYEMSTSYADGVFEQYATTLMEGDLNAAVNPLFHTILEVMNETAVPPPPSELMEFLNATDLDLSDFYITVAIEENSIEGDMRIAAIVPTDPVNETSFKLETLFNLSYGQPLPDSWSELSMRVEGGANETHQVWVEWPGGEPIPDIIDPYGRFVSWENVSLCDIANLTFTLWVNTPPTVSAITITDRALEPGDDISGSVTASDVESYVNVTVSFKGPDGWHNITAQPEGGAFTFSTSTEGWDEGEYTVYATATDAHGTATTYQDPDKVTVKTPFPTMLVIGVAGVALIILAILIFFWRRGI